MRFKPLCIQIVKVHLNIINLYIQIARNSLFRFSHRLILIKEADLKWTQNTEIKTAYLFIFIE